MAIEQTVQELVDVLNNLSQKNIDKYNNLFDTVKKHILANPSYDTDTFKNKECVSMYEDIKGTLNVLKRIEQRRTLKNYYRL